MVIAGEPEFLENRKDIITNPKVIIEVLSKSTESYDKEDKFKAYRTIPSFGEYLLIVKIFDALYGYIQCTGRMPVLHEC